MFFIINIFFFFFSSRRRHTRYIGDWSSDVCSSDLFSGHSPRDRTTRRGSTGRPLADARRRQRRPGELSQRFRPRDGDVGAAELRHAHARRLGRRARADRGGQRRAGGNREACRRLGRQRRDPTPESRRRPLRPHLELGALGEAGMVRALAPVMLFELGNCATTLLILRATGLLHSGRSIADAAAVAVLLFAAHNLVGSALSYPAGHVVDRRGPRVVFGVGAVLFGLAYAGLALSAHGWPLLPLFFALTGAGLGLTATAEPALVARLLPDELRGSGFGLLGAVQSLGDFVSSAAVGLVWTLVSPAAAFVVAAAWMALSLVATAAVSPGRRNLFSDSGRG